MTDQELQQLAREYAEAMCPVEDYSCGDYIDLEERGNELPIYRDDAMQVLRWLTKTHCIADKDKAKAFYNGDTFGELDFIELVSCRRILKSLFGPELFEERSEK